MPNTHSLDLELSSNQYAYITDTASLSITGDMTIELWVKLESVDIVQTLVAKWYNTNNERSYMIQILDSDNKPGLYISSDGTASTVKYWSTALTAGTWTHLAVSYDASAGTCAFYRNGSTDGTGSSLPTSIENNASRFSIGARNTEVSAGNPLDGLIDDARVWNDIRTPTEISDNYLKELVGNEGNLVGYWKLNNSYLDETANDNDLTASGNPVFSTDVPFRVSSGFFALL